MSEQKVRERWPDAVVQRDYSIGGNFLSVTYSVWNQPMEKCFDGTGYSRALLAFGKSEADAWNRAAESIFRQEGKR